MTAPGPAAELRLAVEARAPRLYPFAARIAAFDVIGSTNDEAARLAAHGAEEGTLVVADAQTGGRGRAGRSWFSPPGAGLYYSVVLRPAARASSGRRDWLRFVTLAAGVGVAEGILAATSLPVEIKWPNDLVVSDAAGPRAADRRWRKVAGILAEGAVVGSAVQHVIVGIGINIRHVALPRELAGRATSLEAEAGRPVDRGAVLVETLAALRARYHDLRDGRARHVLARWRELSPAAAGARVAVHHDGVLREGITAGLDDDGALTVRTGDRTEAVVSGELTWI